MALPASVGGAILLSNVVFQLGRTLISSHKSTIVEASAREDLLQSLKHALNVGHRLIELPPHDGHQEDNPETNTLNVYETITTCLPGLRSLSACVAYGNQQWDIQASDKRTQIESLVQDVEAALLDLERRQFLSANSHLSIHISSYIWGLNLAISCLSRSFGLPPISDVSSTRKDDDSLHSLENRDGVLQSQQENAEMAAPYIRCSPTPMLTFSLWAQSFHEIDDKIYCPNASFCLDWLNFDERLNTTRPMFTWRCASTHCPTHSGWTERWGRVPDRSFYLLPTSLLVSTAGYRDWTMYVGSSRERNPVRLTLTDIPLPETLNFVQRANQLAVLQAKIHVAANLNTLPIAFTEQNGHLMVRVLKATTNTIPYADSIYQAIFQTATRTFTTKHIYFCELLFSKYIPGAVVTQGNNANDREHAFYGIPFAELLLPCEASKQGPQSLYTIRFDYSTKINTESNQRHIQMANVTITCSEFRLEFTSSKSAQDALCDIRAMQHETWISYLRCCRIGERVVFERRLGDIVMPGLFLPDAHLEVIQGEDDLQNRLIIGGSDLLVSLCLLLTEDVIHRLLTGTVDSSSTYPMWVVQTHLEKIKTEKWQIEAQYWLTPLHNKEVPIGAMDESARNGFLQVLRACRNTNKDSNSGTEHRHPPDFEVPSNKRPKPFKQSKPRFEIATDLSEQYKPGPVSFNNIYPQHNLIATAKATPHTGHTYAKTVMKDNSKAHFGDVIHHHYHAPADPKLLSLQIHAQLSRLFPDSRR